VQIPPGTLVTTAGTTQVTLGATPQPPLPTAAGQYLWSEVYEVTVSPSGRLRPGDLQPTITMRAATAQQPAPQIAYYAAGRWHPIPTFAGGVDIYQAQLTRFGRWAVLGTVPLDLSKLKGRGSGGGHLGLFIGIGVLVVLAGLFLLGRRRRRRGRARAATSEAGDIGRS
jgi:hypothetical protein